MLTAARMETALVLLDTQEMTAVSVLQGTTEMKMKSSVCFLVLVELRVVLVESVIAMVVTLDLTAVTVTLTSTEIPLMLMESAGVKLNITILSFKLHGNYENAC